MVLGKNKNASDNNKLHKLFNDYQSELEKVLNGIIDKTITPQEINKSFKKVDKVKIRIQSFRKYFQFW